MTTEIKFVEESTEITKSEEKILGKFSKYKIQQLASKFFENRTESNFNPLYKEIVKIINSVAPPIVKYDRDKIATIVGDITITVWHGKNADDQDIYSDDRSFLSWVFISARNKAIQHYKKVKRQKELCESDMVRDGKEDEYNSFDNATFGVGHYAEIEDIDLDTENQLFHNNKKLQVEFVEEKLKSMYEGEEYEVLHKAMILQISPETIAQDHGINSRITVSTRNTRAKQKIAKELEEAIQSSKMFEDITKDGSFTRRIRDCEIKCERKGGVLHGTCKKFHVNGSIKTEGEYRNGKKVGEWKSYYDNGVLESILNYSDDALPFILYDRYGSEEKIGCLN